MQLKKIAACLAVPSLAFSLAACGNDGSNITKEQFTKGYVNVVKKTAPNAPEAMVKKLADCTYDKIKGKVDGKILKKVADGDTKGKISKKDSTTLTNATKECSKDLISSTPTLN